MGAPMGGGPPMGAPMIAQPAAAGSARSGSAASAASRAHPSLGLAGRYGGTPGTAAGAGRGGAPQGMPTSVGCSARGQRLVYGMGPGAMGGAGAPS